MSWTRGQNGKPPRRRLAFVDDAQTRPADDRLDVPRVETPRRAAFRDLETVLLRDGADAAARRFHELRRHAPRVVGEGLVNTLGYSLLAQRKLAAAIDAFKLNVEAFPESFNAHDSLAEAYLDAGEVALAMLHYRRSLELNPQNANGAEMLERLRRQRFFEH